MKTKLTALLTSLITGSCLLPASAQLTIPSDGSDGVLNVTSNTVIDLSQAVTGSWDINNSANAGKGVYDQSKWAIVFKYQSVNIATNVTLTFANHASRAAVVWLVQSNVSIVGNLSLNGQAAQGGTQGLFPSEPGPGGHRGGPSGPQGSGAGLGPGGAPSIAYANSDGFYSTYYGNPQILPLIGGSGGAGGGSYSASAAGGAILIAAGSTVWVDGNITSVGGSSANTGHGSGGAVRVIANSVVGSGQIYCLSDGRIRIETTSLAQSLRTSPETIGVSPANPPIIWPPNNAPSVRIVSVDSVNAPTDPTAPLVSAADVAIQNNSPVDIILQTQNFPIEGTVQVRIAQKWGSAGWYNTSFVSGNQTQATWKLTTGLVKGFCTLQARVTAP